MFLELLKILTANNATIFEVATVLSLLSSVLTILSISIISKISHIIITLYEKRQCTIFVKTNNAYKMKIVDTFNNMAKGLVEDSNTDEMVSLSDELRLIVEYLEKEDNGGGDDNDTAEPLRKQTGEDTNRVSNAEEPAVEA